MAGKMSPKFVALCTLAIGAIYTTGYSITSTSSTALATTQQGLPNATGSSAVAAANGSAGSGQSASKAGGSSASTANKANASASGTTKTSSTTHPATSTQTTTKSTSTASTTSRPATASSISTTSKPAAPKVNTNKYLDGNYNGSASNQIGGVSLAVSIHNGKIANVQITACDTHYPQSYIDPVLPDFVVANQTTQIPVVSGATMSTADFYYALVQALSQAQNPNYKG